MIYGKVGAGGRGAWLSAALALMLLASGCGGAAAGGSAPASGTRPTGSASGASAPAGAAAEVSPSSPLGQLIAEAKREGTLDVTTPASAAGGDQVAHDVVSLIAKRYGVHLQLNYTPAPAMPVMLARLEQEQKANQTASSDLWMGASIQVVPAVQQGLLRTVAWTDYIPQLKALAAGPRNQVDVRSQALALYVQIPDINYNTQLVPKSRVPHKLTDLLDPWWKGKLATTVYGAYINDLGAKSLWGEPRTLAFERRLLAQKPGLLRCGDDNPVASGQYAAFALDCTASYALQLAAKGAPVGWSVPTDAALLDENYIGVPKNAPHAAAAELYAVTFLGAQAQADLWSHLKADDYQLPGSHAAQLIRDAESQGAHFTNVGYPFGLDHPGVAVTNKALNQMIKAAG